MCLRTFYFCIVLKPQKCPGYIWPGQTVSQVLRSTQRARLTNLCIVAASNHWWKVRWGNGNRLSGWTSSYSKQEVNKAHSDLSTSFPSYVHFMCINNTETKSTLWKEMASKGSSVPPQSSIIYNFVWLVEIIEILNVQKVHLTKLYIPLAIRATTATTQTPFHKAIVIGGSFGLCRSLDLQANRSLVI